MRILGLAKNEERREGVGEPLTRRKGTGRENGAEKQEKLLDRARGKRKEARAKEGVTRRRYQRLISLDSDRVSVSTMKGWVAEPPQQPGFPAARRPIRWLFRDLLRLPDLGLLEVRISGCAKDVRSA
jgi:hypothetical protein